jgi:putative peptidoglycan lipid II flippase
MNLQDEGLRQIGRLMGPGIAGLAAVQVNLFVNSWLATSLGTGAVSWLDYAFRLMYMPIGLFGISIATAALPNISGHAAANDTEGVRQSVSSGLRMMLVLNVPATAGLAALAAPIVKLIYEHGRFTPADTAATAGALMYYAPGLIGYSAVKLISPAFYALGSSRIPLIASGTSVIANIALNLVLVRTMGHRGLALGTAIAALCNAAILIALLRKQLGGLEGARIFTATWKIVLASTVMAAAAYEAERWLHLPLPGDAVIVQAIRVFGAIAAGLLVLGLCAQLLRIREFTESLSAVVRSS